MSREDLSGFIHAAEHSGDLRRKLQKCRNSKSRIILLAKDYGFILSDKDFLNNSKEDAICKWFKKSKIDPIKHSPP
tara:strand:+ start:235 stop:462 length:228 start_codon:yes stop_codon:yes gene_type:complete